MSPGCTLCDEAYPLLQQASGTMPVLMVAQQGLEETRAKVTEFGLTFPVVYDSMGVLTDPLRISGLPSAAWIAADGTLRKAAGGRLASKRVIELALESNQP